MDTNTSGQARGWRAAVNGTAGWRTLRAWAHLGASLAMIATALSGCASRALEQAIGHDPRGYPPVVEAYEWAGRRGDELVVVYRLWGGHPRRHETRWTSIDLGTATWAADLGAPRVGELRDRPDRMPDREATDLVPVVPLFGPLEPEVANARYGRRRAGPAAVALYARGGSAPELIVVAQDAASELRSASWALRPTEHPGRAESAPRQLARGAAGAVDVGTAPVQLLLLMLGVVRVH